MSNNIHLGDFGNTFKFTILDQDSVIVDISDADDILFKFEKPDTTQVLKDGELFTDGKDGIVFYVTESGLFDQSGYWKVNGTITKSGVYQFTSNVARFKIEEEL